MKCDESTTAMDCDGSKGVKGTQGVGFRWCRRCTGQGRREILLGGRGIGSWWISPAINCNEYAQAGISKALGLSLRAHPLTPGGKVGAVQGRA